MDETFKVSSASLQWLESMYNTVGKRESFQQYAADFVAADPLLALLLSRMYTTLAEPKHQCAIQFWSSYYEHVAEYLRDSLPWLNEAASLFVAHVLIETDRETGPKCSLLLQFAEELLEDLRKYLLSVKVV